MAQAQQNAPRAAISAKIIGGLSAGAFAALLLMNTQPLTDLIYMVAALALGIRC